MADVWIQRSPLQQADYDYNVAVSNEIHWERQKKKAFKRYEAELAKANKCRCERCPTCGKEKS